MSKCDNSLSVHQLNFIMRFHGIHFYFSVYIQFYLSVVTMFLDEYNNILVTYLDFR